MWEVGAHIYHTWACEYHMTQSLLTDVDKLINFNFPLLISHTDCSRIILLIMTLVTQMMILSFTLISFWTAAACGPMQCCRSSGWAPCCSFSPGAPWRVLPCPHGSSGSWSGQSLNGPASSAAGLQSGSTSRAVPPTGGAGWWRPGGRAAGAGRSLRGLSGPTWWQPGTGTGGSGRSCAGWGSPPAGGCL